MNHYRASQGCQSLTSYLPAGREVSIKNYHRNLPKHDTDKRQVLEYLRDYPKGLTVCEFLEKRGVDAGEISRLKFRPRFCDLFTEGKVTKSGCVCKVCGRKETKYKLCEV